MTLRLLPECSWPFLPWTCFEKIHSSLIPFFYFLGPLAEARVGAETQEYKLMQRLQDTNSVWDSLNKGLRSVVMTTLQLSLHGYGAILPDMIGGNCYGNKPSKELFIRWIQLNAFLPVIQFSLAPWKFDEEVRRLSYWFSSSLKNQIRPFSNKVGIYIKFLNNQGLYWVAPVQP